MSVVGFLKCKEHSFVKVGCVEAFVTSEKRSHIEAIIIKAPLAAAKTLHIYILQLAEDKSWQVLQSNTLCND